MFITTHIRPLVHEEAKIDIQLTLDSLPENRLFHAKGSRPPIGGTNDYLIKSLERNFHTPTFLNFRQHCLSTPPSHDFPAEDEVSGGLPGPTDEEAEAQIWPQSPNKLDVGICTYTPQYYSLPTNFCKYERGIQLGEHESGKTYPIAKRSTAIMMWQLFPTDEQEEVSWRGYRVEEYVSSEIGYGKELHYEDGDTEEVGEDDEDDDDGGGDDDDGESLGRGSASYEKQGLGKDNESVARSSTLHGTCI